MLAYMRSRVPIVLPLLVALHIACAIAATTDDAANALDARAAQDGAKDSTSSVTASNLVLDFSSSAGPPVGVYTLSQIETARRHPGAPAVIAQRRLWIDRNLKRIFVDKSADAKRLVQAALGIAELECLTGDTAYRAVRLSLCRRIAAGWPMGLDRHNQKFPLLDLCRIASLTQDARVPLRPVFERALVEIESPNQTLFGTSIGNTQWLHYWLLRALGRYDDALHGALHGYGKPESTNYEYWSLPRLLMEAADEHGLFNFGGTDIWYWGMTSHPAFVAVGWEIREHLPDEARRRFDLVYVLPLRLLGHGGAHPHIGEAVKNPKDYAFFSRWQWTWRSDDDASRWARARIAARDDPLSFDDLTLPPLSESELKTARENTRAHGNARGEAAPDDRPPIARGNRRFGERLTFIEEKNQTIVIFGGDGRPLNAGHRSPPDTPKRQKIQNGRVSPE